MISKIKFLTDHQHYQQSFMSSLKPSGHVVGTGRCKLLLPTPQIMADESTSCHKIIIQNKIDYVRKRKLQSVNILNSMNEYLILLFLRDEAKTTPSWFIKSD